MFDWCSKFVSKFFSKSGSSPLSFSKFLSVLLFFYNNENGEKIFNNFSRRDETRFWVGLSLISRVQPRYRLVSSCGNTRNVYVQFLYCYLPFLNFQICRKLLDYALHLRAVIQQTNCFMVQLCQNFQT